MNARRLYAPSVLGTVIIGGLAFLAASRTWAAATIQAKGLPPAPLKVSGADAVPLVPALALVIVAAALAVLAASVRVRRVVGVLVIAVAIIAIVTILRADGAIDSAVASAVHDSPAFIGNNTPQQVSHGAWRWVALLAFVGAAAIGVIIGRFGADWPTMGRKYEAPTAHTVVTEDELEADIWKALDEGRDPTQ